MEMLHVAFIVGRQLQLQLFCTELQNCTVHRNVPFGVLYITVLLSHCLSSHQNTYKQYSKYIHIPLRFIRHLTVLTV